MARLSKQNLIKRRSRCNFGSRSIAVFVSVVLLSSAAVTTQATSVQIAQQPQATSRDDANRAAAERLDAEADQLFKQGTAQSGQQAIAKYEKALQLWRAVGDRAEVATTLRSIGLVYHTQSSPQKALEFYNQAVVLFRSLKERSEEASTLRGIGLIYYTQGGTQKALDYYNQARALFRAVGDRKREASTLNDIGGFYSDLGEKQKALDSYNRALVLQRAVGDRPGEANTLNNIGEVYSNLGDYQLSLESYNRGLSLYRVVGDRNGEVQTLNSIATVYRLSGDDRKALDTANSERLSGDYQKALDAANSALSLARALKDHSSEVTVLATLVRVYESLGDDRKALDTANSALTLARAQKNPLWQGTALTLMGRVYQASDNGKKALDSHNQALLLFRKVGIARAEANTLDNIGKVYSDLGSQAQARDFYNQALSLRRTLGDRTGEADTLYSIASVERKRGSLNQSKTQIEAALKIVESLRTKVASPELRTSYFASVQKYYQFYTDLLMQLHQKNPKAGYDALALQASERARARSLLELLTEANIDIRRGVEPALLERERTLLGQINALTQRQQQLTNSPRSPQQAAAFKQELDTLQSQYQQVQAQIRQSSPRYAALTQPQPLTLAQIQQLLEPDTLLLEYSLGSERSYLWAVTPNSITSYELPSQSEIEKASKQFYQLLTDKRYAYVKQDLAKVSAQLSQMLLGPVAKQLGEKRLVVVSNGALQYIPFGALSEPLATRNNEPQPLLVKHEVVSLPSASTLAVIRRESGRQVATKTVAVFADPVFDSSDPRVQRRTPSRQPVPESYSLASVERSAKDVGITNAKQSLPRLPGTRLEAEQILALVPPSERKQVFGFEANASAASSPDLSKYRLLHFGTHGLLNSENPELSGVVLSLVDQQGKPQDGFLGLTQVYNLNLSADLVVLSACQTGLGQQVQGEGLVGLTRGFMYAGTPRVVASMWNVDDAATAELMQRFYRGMLKQKLPPAAALRAAQVAMWRQQQWRAPYYWAAFVFQGEWK